ncbi:MAG: sensor histidine kinase [Thermoleophilaceae bacterium]
MTPPSPLQRARLRLPIRAKLATVSAALTFVILCLFAVVIGILAAHRLRGNFDDDLRATAADLQDRINLQPASDGTLRLDAHDLQLLRLASAGEGVVRVIDADGRVKLATRNVALGPPVEGVQEVGKYRVVTRPMLAARLARPGPFDIVPRPVAEAVAFLQYAKPENSVERTIARVHLFLALGVLGGTALAFLAGLLVARRAMRPISGLTRAARQVARTRDPAVTLPKPEANDEIADLANTLEDMLSELGAARTETEAALGRQREFVADASHELRTPLTSILANLELLESELAGEQREIAESALRSSRRMRRLVADLLLLARADAGRGAPRRPADLAAVAREAVAEAGPLAPEHPIALDAPGSVVLEGAPDDLHRMALNLVENALLHTPAGTPITVSVRADEAEAVLEVADRGPGIPPGMRERVFERFTRVDADRARAGSGLGLAIVRAVAHAHGGQVSLGGADGGGTRFEVRLPLVYEPGPPPDDEVSATPRPRRAAPSAGA